MFIVKDNDPDNYTNMLIRLLKIFENRLEFLLLSRQNNLPSCRTYFLNSKARQIFQFITGKVLKGLLGLKRNIKFVNFYIYLYIK